MTEIDLTAKLAEKEKQAQKLARIIQANQEKIKQFTEINLKKDEEIKQYIEKIKTLERRTDDAYKNVTTGNISDINEIKTQFDKEKLVLLELIRTLKNNIDEKNEQIQKSREESNELRLLIEEERKKFDSIMSINLSKFDAKSSEVQYYKISTEISSLRTKLTNAEEKLEKQLEQNEKLKRELLENDKNAKRNQEHVSSELNAKNTSYKTLLKDYHNTVKSLQICLDDLSKSKYFNKKYEDDIALFEKKLRNIDHDLIELRGENEGLKLRLKSNESELETNRKKIKDYEAKLNEIRLSKQVFDVTYYYMNSLPIVGKFIMQKEGDAYIFIIENRTSSRKFSFLDIDIRRDVKDSTKLYVKFIKENHEEEYYSNEIGKILEYYEDFRKRTIELSTEIEARTRKESKENEKKVNDMLKNAFKF
jgi:chromosome segregation ATPase